jgi:S-adenosyl methyltransferase
MSAFPSGSYVALSHGTVDKNSPDIAERVRKVYEGATEQLYLRERDEIERFFAGLEIVPPHDGMPPALSHLGAWGADVPAVAESDGSRWAFCAVARKP